MENCMFFTRCFKADGEAELSKPAFSSCRWLWRVARIWVLFCFVFLVCHLMGQKVGVIQIYLVMDTFLQWQSTSHLYLWYSRGADWSIEDYRICMCLAFQEHTCEHVSRAALSCGWLPESWEVHVPNYQGLDTICSLEQKLSRELEGILGTLLF